LMKMVGSTGWPWCLKFSTNKDLIEKVGLRRLAVMVIKRMNSLLQGKDESDPARIFVKREPHKKEKIEAKRWRLIWGVSWLDQVIDSVLFDASLDAEIDNHERIPSKPGWSWVNGGMDKMAREIYRGRKEIAETDKTSWDFTVPKWIYDWDLERRQRLCLDWGTDARFEFLFQKRYELLSMGSIVFSDGTVYQQMEPGIVRSGSKLTISLNSASQVMLKISAALDITGEFDWQRDMIFTMGDDTLERLGFDKEAYKGWLVERGFIIKRCEVDHLEGAEFCSHRFRDKNGFWAYEPANWNKHVFRLKYPEDKKKDVLAETLSSLRIEYFFCDKEYALLTEKLIQIAPEKCKSRHALAAVAYGSS